MKKSLITSEAGLAKKASGIITPVRAQDTGLIPDGWAVESDNLEGDINLANLDYLCLVCGESYIDGDTMLERAGNAYGSLGFAAALLKAQKEGKEIFPVESRGKHCFIMPRTILLDSHHCFIMPRTILLDSHRSRRVAYFLWDGQWL